MSSVCLACSVSGRGVVCGCRGLLGLVGFGVCAAGDSGRFAWWLLVCGSGFVGCDLLLVWWFGL